MDFFRICQETLRIIVTEATVAEVIIRMEHKNNKACLTISMVRHDGNNSLKEEAPDLTGICKRVASINGHFSSNGEDSKVWKMTVFAPLPMTKMNPV